MAGVTGPPGWWLASDGKWYPPSLHPGPSPQTNMSQAGGPDATPTWTGPPVPVPSGLPQFAPFAPSDANPSSGFARSYPYPSAPPLASPFGIAPRLRLPTLAVNQWVGHCQLDPLDCDSGGSRIDPRHHLRVRVERTGFGDPKVPKRGKDWLWRGSSSDSPPLP